MAARPRRLSDVCSPTFLFLTTFRKNLVDRKEMSLEWVKAELARVLREQKHVAQQDQAIYPLYERAERLLVYTADGIIRGSTWVHADEWEQNLLEVELYATPGHGGLHFFQHLETPQYDDPQLSEIAFMCLGIGFMGAYKGSPEKLREKKATLFAKVQDVPRERQARMTPDAYDERIDKGMPSLPVVRTMRLLACLVGVVLFLVVGKWLLFDRAVDELTKLGKEIAEDHHDDHHDPEKDD